jgi:ribosomal-protein-alanine N-acetyltransferase
MRTLSPDEVSQDYVNWLKDPQVNRFLELRHQTHTLSSVFEFVQSIDQSEDAVMFGLFLLATGKHIGNLKLSGLASNRTSGEIGYLIGVREVWGKGYATEAIVALSDFAFSELELTELTAGAYSENRGSIRVLEKCGFVRSEAKTTPGGPHLNAEVFTFTLYR